MSALQHLPRLAAILLCAPLATQHVWDIPAGAEIQPFVDGATPGDILRLAPGRHTKFHLDRGLTIVGPATIGSSLVRAANLTIAIPMGQIARFANLDIRPDFGPGLLQYGNVQIDGGLVVFEDCVIVGAAANTEASLVATSASVVIDHTVVQGIPSGAALRAYDSHITLTDSTITGLDAIGPAGAGFAIHATGTVGSLHASSIRATGGSVIGPVIGDLCPRAAVFSEVDTWITDSNLRGGSSEITLGAVGIHATNTRFARTQIIAGTGTATAVPTSGQVIEDPSLLGVTSSLGPFVGANFGVTYLTEPGVAVAVLLSSSLLSGPVAFAPIAQPLWATTLFAGAALTTDTAGAASLAISVPNDPTLEFVAFDFLGFRIAGSVVQAAPVVAALLR